jgi:CHAD domain-containing protein
MYRELVPEWRAAWIEKQLKRIREASNDARDSDVFARRLEQDSENAAALELAKRVRVHRVESQQSIAEVYQRLKHKRRFERRIAKLLKRVRLRGKKIKAKNPCFSEWSTKKFTQLLDEFFQAAKCHHSDVEALHAFRISGKKVRYAMELLAGAYPEHFRQDVYSGLEKLQDKLGRINDHVNSGKRIRFWIDEAAKAKKQEIDYLKEILRKEETLLEQSKAEFCSWWNEKREAKTLEMFNEVIGNPPLSPCSKLDSSAGCS